MAGLLDGFYALSDEERYYRDLYLKGRNRAEYINLPAEVEASARLEEKIVLSSGYYSDEDRASVIVLKHPNYMPLYLHSHRFVEMCYVASGHVLENIEGKTYDLPEGSLLVLLPGFYHSIGVFDDNTVAVNLIVRREFFASLDERFSLGLSELAFAAYGGLELHDDIEAMLAMQQRGDGISCLEMEVAAEAMLLDMKRNGTLLAKGNAEKRNEVFRIMSYIEENLRTVTLSSFAGDFGLSEQYASRMVKEKTGQLFSAIVHKLRMEAACQLLKNGRVPIKEVAYQVGYSSAEQFSRTFRACYAVSPREYRRRMLI